MQDTLLLEDDLVASTGKDSVSLYHIQNVLGLIDQDIICHLTLEAAISGKDQVLSGQL